MSSDPAITVLMAGLPGAMGVAVSEACLRRGFALAPFGLAGPGRSGEVQVGGQSVTLLPAHGDAAAAAIAELQRACAAAAAPSGPRTIVVVDYTHPSAVNANGELYAKHGLPFVMGTTGGDREALLAATAAGAGSGYAVVAANMCKQIVALQATMAHMAATFPGAFGGYELSIVESHQSTKADTSGTAKDMICHFNGLTGGGGGVAAGLEAFGVDDVRKLREAEAQLAFGVPEAALAGHAYHTYALTSGAGDVRFEFKHNVQGRTTYAEGTADAVQFLAAKVAAAAGAGGAAAAGEQKIFNMIDILQAGAMS